MTIKEIARLAGVSVSTVSKIMNNKDSSISAKTREHVLRIAKEYNYSPYASSITPQAKTLTLGVIFRDGSLVRALTPGMLGEASRRGYSLLLKESGLSPDTELKNITALIAARVDGVLWEPVGEDSLAHGRQLEKDRIPFCLFHWDTDGAPGPDFRKAGYLAARRLAEKGHTEIACLAGNDRRALAFREGFQACLFELGLPLRKELEFTSAGQLPVNTLAGRAFSGIAVCRYEDALRLYQLMDTLHYSVPGDFSLITLLEEGTPAAVYPELSALTIPWTDYGAALADRLIRSIEKQEPGPEPDFSFPLNSEATIGSPPDARRKRILSIGSINVDHYLKFETLPRTGRTVTSSDSAVYPGGKCLNEAIGVARLGHSASIIGLVGNDAASDMIYRAVRDCRIDPSGLRRTGDAMTGQAYIFVQANGESMISILSGANAMMSVQEIRNNERLFSGASHCLIQTEIPMPAVMEAARLAKKHRLVTVLKPSSCSGLPAALLQNTDILIPNLEELHEICPGSMPEEEKAQYFLEQGVGTVIVTKGASGCGIYEKGGVCQLPAASFPAVDNTGAGDAFISALVSYLIYGCDMVTAAKIASYAAGFSISRQGVSNALADKNTLEAYLRIHEPELLRERQG